MSWTAPRGCCRHSGQGSTATWFIFLLLHAQRQILCWCNSRNGLGLGGSAKYHTAHLSALQKESLRNSKGTFKKQSLPGESWFLGIHCMGSTAAATPALPSNLCMMVLVPHIKDTFLFRNPRLNSDMFSCRSLFERSLQFWEYSFSTYPISALDFTYIRNQSDK